MAKKWLGILAGILFFCLATGWVSHALFGHQPIKSAHSGRSTGTLHTSSTGRQTTHPPEYYLKFTDTLFFNLTVILVIMVFLFLGLRLPPKALLGGLLIIFIGFGIVFIAKASFLYKGVRYFTLFDDVMISMRYAKNLSQGYGLVWNPGGERVEGYTNFLWTVYMAFWHLFPLDVSKIALPIQLSGMFFLLLALSLVNKIANDLSHGNKYVSLGAVLLTASYLPITFWALRGMETSVLAFIVLLATWRFFNLSKTKTFDPWIFVVLGIGMLTRADFALLFVGSAAFFVIAETNNGRKNFLFASFTFLLVIGGQTFFRWAYYGDILPNTYYLKMTGVPTSWRIQQGEWAAFEFVHTMSPILFSLPFVYGLFHLKDKKILFLLYMFSLQLLYSIYVGGDTWEWWGHFANRYLCIVMPLFFIVLSMSVNYLIDKITKSGSGETGPPAVMRKNLCFSIIFVFLIFQIHGGLKNFDLADKRLFNVPMLHVKDDELMVKFGLKLKEITNPGAKIAMIWAGSLPYFSERTAVDLLGKNDSFISHLPARIKNFREFHPGHNKYDCLYSIGKLKPDIVVQFWEGGKEAYPLMVKYYLTVDTEAGKMYLRKNSTAILWDKVNMTGDAERLTEKIS